MSLKIRLTAIIIAIITVIITALTIITVTRSTKMQTETVYLYAHAIAGESAKELQRRIEVFADYAHILSLIMSDFETTPEYLRRDSYDDFILSTIQQNPLISGIWTAWLPDTIDSKDGELGVFKPYYSRRLTGDVDFIAAGYEDHERYLKEMISYGKPILEDPVWREFYGRERAAVISIQSPVKNRKGSVVGIIGINYISDMQEVADELSKQIYDGAGVAGVYSNDGVVAAHYDKNRIGKNIGTYEGERELLGDQHSRIVEAIKNGGEDGNPVSIDRYSPLLGETLCMIYYPISISGFEKPWCLLLGIPRKEIDEPVNNMMWFTIIIAVIILGIAALITFLVAQNVVKPIIYVTNTLKDISEGEGDLTRRIDNHSNDEIGDLSLYFNNTLEKIKLLIILIRNEALKLSGVGQDLSSNMNETAAAINQITANIQNIKGRVMNQSASVTQTNATMEQVTININKLNKQVEEQSTHVAQASAAIEQMVANISSVTETLKKNSANVKTLRDASDIGRTGLQDVAADIQEIAKESEGLLEINSVMQNIASQTNLLSMNAAIEAAHAGDAGRGFAVVADEIRKLAESSSIQSKTISSVLKKIKSSIDKITQSTESVLNRFEAIDSNVVTVSEQEDIIRNAMEEQKEGSKQLLDGVTKVNDITRLVKSGSNEMLEGANEVIHESANLEKVTQEITSGMNEMASGADQINVAVNHVNDISIKNQEGIDTLIKEVGRFKVE